VRSRREKDARRFCPRKAAHVAKALDPRHALLPPFFRIGPRVDPVFNTEQFRYRAVAQQHDAKARLRFGNLAGGYRSPFETRPVRTRGFGRPKQDGQVRIAQAFIDFRNEIVADFNIDFAEPGLDLLSFELGSEDLDELLVLRAVGKKDFHPVADPPGDIIAMHRLTGRLSCSSLRARGKEERPTQRQ
jgi:hypothetical protein